MSLIKVWIHAVWGTHNREPILVKEVRATLWDHIKSNALSKEIYIDTINGHLDHVHCLFELNTEVSFARTMQLLKGGSSHWANKHQLVRPKLDWANEYFAASVSESLLHKVRMYIDNQEAHHKKITFAQEYEMFLQKYGLRKDKQRAFG